MSDTYSRRKTHKTMSTNGVTFGKNISHDNDSDYKLDANNTVVLGVLLGNQQGLPDQDLVHRVAPASESDAVVLNNDGNAESHLQSSCNENVAEMNHSRYSYDSFYDPETLGYIATPARVTRVPSRRVRNEANFVAHAHSLEEELQDQRPQASTVLSARDTAIAVSESVSESAQEEESDTVPPLPVSRNSSPEKDQRELVV
jgi:hypothetical protein